MKKPSFGARYYRVYKKSFGFLIKVFPYLFLGGLVGMLLGDIFIGERAWAIVYYVTVFPVLVLWLLGTGVGCLWWLAMRQASGKEPSVFSTHGLVLLAVGGVFSAGGLMFAAKAIQEILGL